MRNIFNATNQIKIELMLNKGLNMNLQLLIQNLVHLIRFNVFWTEDLILRLLAEGIKSIRVIDKKLLSHYQLTRFKKNSI